MSGSESASPWKPRAGRCRSSAVLSPPTAFIPWMVTVCEPADTANDPVEYAAYAVPTGVIDPTTDPSTRTWRFCPVAWLLLLARCAAENVIWYAPPGSAETAWVTDPVICRNPTWVPSGAAGLKPVNPLPLPETPARAGERPGRPGRVVLEVRVAAAEPTEGDSKPVSDKGVGDGVGVG